LNGSRSCNYRFRIQAMARGLVSCANSCSSITSPVLKPRLEYQPQEFRTLFRDLNSSIWMFTVQWSSENRIVRYSCWLFSGHKGCSSIIQPSFQGFLTPSLLK
jgi:hypothetical protein